MTASREEEIVAEKLINEGKFRERMFADCRIQDMEEELVSSSSVRQN